MSLVRKASCSLLVALALGATGCAFDGVEESPEVTSSSAALASSRTVAVEAPASRSGAQGTTTGTVSIGGPRPTEAPSRGTLQAPASGDGEDNAADPRPHPWQPPPDRTTPQDDVSGASAGSEGSGSTK